RLCARRRASRGQEPTRGDPPGFDAALPADIDDYICRALRRAAADARHGRRLGVAPSARSHHGRRADRQPGAHALHHARDLPLLRPPGAALSPSGARVNLSAPFVARPVATTLLAIGVVLAGAVAFTQLPVSPLPQVD